MASLVSGKRRIAFRQPRQVFLVVPVGGIERYEGVVGKALHACCRLSCETVVWKLLIHNYSSAEAAKEALEVVLFCA